MNQNSLAIHVLCSHMASQAEAKPFEPKEWTEFASLLQQKNKMPEDILKMDQQTLVSELGLADEFAFRIIKLLDRSTAIGFEISEYENMGIKFLTRADSNYPVKIKKKLGKSCPPIFCYAGDLSLLNKSGLGFVGSRNVGNDEISFTQNIVTKALNNGYSIVSGGAKGIDSISMDTALASGGTSIAFLSDSMMDKLKKKEMIKAVQQGRLLLMSSFKPNAPWNVGNAMARNKYIYTQSEGVVVVKSDFEKGGTWAGATENLRNGWAPEYCWDNSSFVGNQKLIQKGATPINEEWSGIPSANDLKITKNEQSVNVQISFFDN